MVAVKVNRDLQENTKTQLKLSSNISVHSHINIMADLLLDVELTPTQRGHSKQWIYLSSLFSRSDADIVLAVLLLDFPVFSHIILNGAVPA